MQYTPRSMAGMNNMSAEIGAAGGLTLTLTLALALTVTLTLTLTLTLDGYAANMRFFTVGMDTSCGDPAKGQADCSQPFSNLNVSIRPQQNHTCAGSRLVHR